MVGCDTLLNAGYTYHIASSQKWVSTPPCFLIDFFEGPRSYIPGVTFVDNNNNRVYDSGIDTPIDTALDVRSKVLGISRYPGVKNLGLSSFFQYNNGTDPANKFQLRDYTLGLNNVGSKINPCTWARGNVLGGVNCANVDPFFIYSGEPVTNIGWINTWPEDQRQISNTSPFQLVKNDTITIVAAYIVGQGTSGLNSITVAKNNDASAQNLFDTNFSSIEGIYDNIISKINYNLYQNYPNPFNPSTALNYSISEQSNVSIKIYDVLGNVIFTLVNENKPKGNYKVEFNADNLSNGIYFYQMKSNEFIQTRKMLLLK